MTSKGFDGNAWLNGLPPDRWCEIGYAVAAKVYGERWGERYRVWFDVANEATGGEGDLNSEMVYVLLSILGSVAIESGMVEAHEAPAPEDLH